MGRHSAEVLLLISLMLFSSSFATSLTFSGDRDRSRDVRTGQTPSKFEFGSLRQPSPLIPMNRMRLPIQEYSLICSIFYIRRICSPLFNQISFTICIPEAPNSDSEQPSLYPKYTITFTRTPPDSQDASRYTPLVHPSDSFTGIA